MSVILITHRLQDIFRVCDRVMVLYEGTNVAEGKRMLEESGLELDFVEGMGPAAERAVAAAAGAEA